MALEIKLLDYGDIELEASVLVLGHDSGRTRRVPVYGLLILGGPWPILVDIGYRDNAIMEALGMRGLQFHENMIENQLARHGVKPGDVRYILHTHLHIDHAGKDDCFPMNTTVVLNRRELEYAVSGLMHPQHPKPDIIHLLERLHTPQALRFLDLELTGGEEICPGVWCEAANAHPEGSMNVFVETAEGLAVICGGVIYNVNDQIVNQVRQIAHMEPHVTGNHAGSKRAEKAAMKKLLNHATFLPPVHDRPAKSAGQRVVGRMDMSVPGPMVGEPAGPGVVPGVSEAGLWGFVRDQGAGAQAGRAEVGVVVAFLIAQQRLGQPLRALIGFKRAAAQARVQHGMIARWP
jgi:glyoxylase-like metal-dependent hydrolase (beta-lactamase superfamily II)